MNKVFKLIKEINHPACGTISPGHIAYKRHNDGYVLNYKTLDDYGYELRRELFLATGDVEYGKDFFEELICISDGDIQLRNLKYYVGIGEDGLKYSCYPTDLKQEVSTMFDLFKVAYETRR